MEKSRSEKLLVGTKMPNGAKITAVSIDGRNPNVRLIETEDGKKTPVLVSRLKSFIDAQLQRTYPAKSSPINKLTVAPTTPLERYAARQRKST